MTSEIELPPHMGSLSQVFIDEISCMPDKDVRIIACGVDPSDNSLCFITGCLDVRIIVPNGTMIPVKSFLEFDGNHMLIGFVGQEKLHRVSSRVLIEMSQSCTNDAQLSTNNERVGNLSLTGNS